MRSRLIAVLAIALVLIACVGTLAGSTVAWFTESITTVNSIRSGTLDVEMNYQHIGDTEWQSVDLTTPLFDPAKLHMPGTMEVVYLQAENAGSLALKYQLGVTAVNSVVGKSVLGNEIHLTDYLQVGVWHLDDHTFIDAEGKLQSAVGETDASAPRAVFEDRALLQGLIKNNPDKMKPLKDYMVGSEAQLPLNAQCVLEGEKIISDGVNPDVVSHDTDDFALVLYLPFEVGNVMNFRGVQPQLTLGIHLHATQATLERDSFGADYDIGAEQLAYPNPEELLKQYNNSQQTNP